MARSTTTNDDIPKKKKGKAKAPPIVETVHEPQPVPVQVPVQPTERPILDTMMETAAHTGTAGRITHHDDTQPASETMTIDTDSDTELEEEFALTPALAHKEVLTYSTGEGAKIFKNGSLKLTLDIDCTTDNLNITLAALEERAVQQGWLDTVLNVVNKDGHYKDLLTQYGEITLGEIKAHVLTYIREKGRAAQDSMMLFTCITNSLTQEARKKLFVYKKEYFIDDRTPSGALLLKVLIRESHIDTHATTKIVRENLSSLDTYMTKIDSDIEKFNQYVYGNIIQLSSRGGQSSDIMANLFKGYAQASDKTFVAYIAKKEDDYDEGRDIGYVALMQLALQKYKVLKESGKWNAPTEEQSKIIALQAEVNKLKFKSTSNKNDKKGQYDKSQANSSKNKSGNQGGNGKNANGNKKAPPDWMITKPKEGEPHKKTMNGKEYHWCPNHQAWTRHKPEECKGKGFKFDSTDKGKSGDKKRKPDDDSNGAKKKPNMVAALTAMYTSEDEEE